MQNNPPWLRLRSGLGAQSWSYNGSRLRNAWCQWTFSSMKQKCVCVCVFVCTRQYCETTTKSWLRDKTAKYSHGKITIHTDTPWSETEKHKFYTWMEATPENTVKFLTMRNYVGGEAIVTIMSTSHPDGLPPATQPQWLILCHVVLYTFFTRAHVGQTQVKEVPTCLKLKLSFPLLDTATQFNTYTTSMIHFLLHSICFPHPYTPMSNISDLKLVTCTFL